MAINVRQFWVNSATGASTTIAATAGSAVLSGSTIVAFGTMEATPSFSSCTDSVNGSYGAIRVDVTDSTNNQQCGCYVFANSAAGTPTVTITFSAADTFRGIFCCEIAEAATSSYGGGTGQGGQNAAGTDGITSGTFTASGQPSLLVAMSMSTGSGTGAAPNAGTSFTSVGTSWAFGTGSDYVRVESRRVTTTSSLAGTFTRVADVLHTNICVSILEAAGGGGGGLATRKTLLGVGKHRLARDEWQRSDGGRIYTRRAA